MSNYNLKTEDVILIYCDASGNNKTKLNGGIGIILKYKDKEKTMMLGQYVGRTTAYLEVRAVLESLRRIKDKTKRVYLYSDNQYCVFAIEKDWISTWEVQGFVNRKNAELWKLILKEIRKWPGGYVKFRWIKGHNGHIENEICDKLAKLGGKQEILIENEEIT